MFLFQADVSHAEQDLEAASRHCIAHGSLLSLRYVFAELPWDAIARQDFNNCEAGFRAALTKVSDLISRVAKVTLPVLALYQDTYLGKVTQRLHTYILSGGLPQKIACSQVYPNHIGD